MGSPGVMYPDSRLLYILYIQFTSNLGAIVVVTRHRMCAREKKHVFLKVKIVYGEKVQIKRESRQGLYSHLR